MLNKRKLRTENQRGTSLLEVLISIIILAVGLLGLAALHGKIQLGEHESYERAQAILLLSDIVERISAHRSQASSYVSSTIVGTGDSQPASCADLANGASRDLCEWSNALKGANERKADASVGAMMGARGCITQVQAADATPGVCTPGIYQVAVAWQGLHQTITPVSNCAAGAYGNESLRRVITMQISAGLLACQ